MGYSKQLTTLLVTKEFLFHRPVLIFQLTENSSASDNQSTQSQKRISSSWRNAHLLSEGVYIGVCAGVWEVEGVQFVSSMKA
jgi:hypothetical protein